MEINWSIIGWLAGLIFVYIFGLFEGRSQGYKKRKAEEEVEKKEQPALKPEIISTDDPGLLRIKNENGSLTLDLDGRRADPSSLSADQRKRLIELLTIMRPWLEAKPATTPEPSPRAPTIESRLDSVSTAPQPKAPDRAQPKPVPAPAPVARPASSARKKDDKTEAAPLTMVGQINEILQGHIANTQLSVQGVTRMESPSGGVNVYIGIDRYEGIDAVPDEQIKALIRAAIAEWEHKYTPGL